MTDHLFLAELAGAKPGDVVRVTGPEGRHAATVKRIRVGESILVADGAGRAVRGPVTAVGKDEISVEVAETLETPDSPHTWVAVQALAKGDRSDIAIESLTELGVNEIHAWQASRSIVRWDKKVDKGLAKWESTAREATKQSRRFRIPEVSAASTADVVELIQGADLALILHEDATEALHRVALPASGRILFVVGPEGGIAPDELEKFVAAGAQLVSLGDGVLRTSSAGVVALAQLQVLVPEA